MRLLPDTNVLVYETVEDSARHLEACRLLDGARHVLLPSIVLHEYAWVMLKLGADPEFVSAKVEEYLRDPRMRYFAEPSTAYREASRMLIEDGAISREFNDYLILAVARMEEAVLATYDRRLKKAASKRGVRVLP